MSNCIFCKIAQKQAPAEIVYEDADFLAFLDIYPQTRGHIQLIPKIHYRWVYDIPEIGQFFITAKAIIHGIIPVLKCDHVRIMTFGQEVEHAHLWIVPVYRKTQEIFEGKKANRPQNQTDLARKLKFALKAI